MMKELKRKTQKSFGLQWRNYTYINKEAEEPVFFQKTGLKPEELKGKEVLDVGCGYGRYSYVALKYGAKVTAFDFSDAVYSAQENLGDYPDFNVIKADLFSLPFKKESFDIIFSIGVLHHTPSTHKAFESLLPYLKKNGKVAIWVYTKRGEPFDSFNDTLRKFTTRLPQKLFYHFCWVASPVGAVFRYLYHKKGFKRSIGFLTQLIPISMNPDWKVRQVDTFDWWSPQYQWHHTIEEVKRWFAENNVEIKYVGEFPVSIMGVKK